MLCYNITLLLYCCYISEVFIMVLNLNQFPINVFQNPCWMLPIFNYEHLNNRTSYFSLKERPK